MTISITETRKIMGKDAQAYTDTQLEEIINLLTALADMAIDTIIVKRKQPEIDKVQT